MITVIGNSIVNGYPFSRGSSFTGILRSKFGYDIVNKGVNGDTVAGICARFEEDVLSKNPKICLILTGTNDFIQGKNTGYVMEKIRKLRSMAGDMTMYFLTPVLTYPSLAEERWIPADYLAVNEEMKRFAAELRKEEYGKVIDLQEEIEKYSEGKDPEKIYVDGIHITRDVHEKIAEYIDSILKGEVI